MTSSKRSTGPRGGLALKGLMIVGLPLILQLGLLGVIMWQNERLEVESVKESHYRRLLTAIGGLSVSSFDAFTHFNKFFYTKSKEELVSVSNELDQMDRAVHTVREEARKEPNVSKESQLNSEEMLATADEICRIFHNAQEMLTKPLSINSACTLFEYRQRLVKIIPQYVEQQKRLLLMSEQLAGTYSEQQVKSRQNARIWILMAALASAVMALFVGSLFSKSIRSRVNTIKDNTILLGSESTLNPPVGGNDEIQQLDEAFRNMAEDLRAAKKDLIESEIRSRSIIDTSPIAFIVADLDGQVQHMNPKAFALLAPARADGEETLLSKLLPEFPLDRLTEVNSETANTEAEQSSAGDAQPGSFELQINRETARTYEVVISQFQFSSLDCRLISFNDITARKEIERLRREMYAMIAHDIRNPLLSIKSAIGSVLDSPEATLNQSERGRLQTSNRHVTTVTTLLNDLLDVERFQSGRFEICPGKFGTKEIVDAAVESINQFLVTKGLTVSEHVEDCYIFCDRDLLVRVLNNLLSNAIKFCPSGSPPIEIHVKKTSGQVRFAVRDYGPGIAKHEQEKLFQRFSQTSTANQARTNSSGLGLAICKMIVEEHDGKIAVESDEGKGCEFWFTIPLVQ